MVRLICFVALFALTGCSDCDSNNNSSIADAGPDADAGGPETPFDAELLGGWGLHVIGRDASDIWVAGGTPDRGTLLHYDGSDWTPESLPADTPLLNWVMPFPDGQVAVAGNGGTVLWRAAGATDWTVQQTPTTEDLWGIWGSAPDDVWAVGGRGRAEGQATVLRFDGTSWTAATLPELERPGVNAWFKVWGTGADNVYIVGQRGGCLRWDGTTLTEFGVGTSEDLISLWGTGPDDILLVGGRGNGVLAHWNGESWHSESISPAPGVNGVWMPAPGEFWLAGVRGMLRRGTVTASDDGAGGLVRGFDVPRTAPLAEADLHAVYGIEGYGLVTVGGNFGAPNGPYEGLAFQKTVDWQ